MLSTTFGRRTGLNLFEYHLDNLLFAHTDLCHYISYWIYQHIQSNLLAFHDNHYSVVSQLVNCKAHAYIMKSLEVGFAKKL